MAKRKFPRIFVIFCLATCAAASFATDHARAVRDAVNVARELFDADARRPERFPANCAISITSIFITSFHHFAFRPRQIYYHLHTAGATCLSVAKCLTKLGWLKALIAMECPSGYAVSRIKKIDSSVDLTRLGLFSSEQVPVIGRVGIPDTQLGVSWTDTMTFYGKWFDELGETDAGYHLRRNISSLSLDHLLDQIRRDDQRALVGSYYSAFHTVMHVKKRVPLVLIDHAHLDLTNFSVVLPKIDEVGLEKKLMGVLRVMLKADSGVRSAPAGESERVDGVEFDELSTDYIASLTPRNDS